MSPSNQTGAFNLQAQLDGDADKPYLTDFAEDLGNKTVEVQRPKTPIQSWGHSR